VIPVACGSLPGCRVVRGDPAGVVRAVEMDSRLVTEGALFVAIRGGHEHTAAARAAGAAAVLVEAGRASTETEGTVLAAADTIAALQAIGAANAAAAGGCTVVGVTGSSGKTSTKDALAALASTQLETIAAAEGHNNEIGLPFTLCRIEPQTEAAICELSMRGPGQIAELAALARPRIGVITNVGEAHLELLGTREAIAAAKAELLAFVELAVVPSGDELLAPYLASATCEVRTFGDGEGDVRIVSRRPAAAGMALALDVRGTPLELETNLTGRHHALNLAAAFAVCDALRLDLVRCAEAAAEIRLQRWRSEPHALPGGGVVVNDAYNANPSSVEAALAALAEHGSGRLVAVLGVMAELGPASDELHRRVGRTAAALGYAVVVAVGPASRGYLEGAGDDVERHWVANVGELAGELADIVKPGDRVLVKASRSAGLEAVAGGLARALSNGTEL
jgi:UDP-N-acetylmuramoyl-tripeptide--D-alanyl-D-alanine ligase